MKFLTSVIDMSCRDSDTFIPVIHTRAVPVILYTRNFNDFEMKIYTYFNKHLRSFYNYGINLIYNISIIYAEIGPTDRNRLLRSKQSGHAQMRT
jgi:uncharacterized membrane protein